MTSRELLRRPLARLVRMVFRPRITGLEHIPAIGPFVVAANHLSFCDHIFLTILVPRPLAFVGKAERFGRRSLRGRLSGRFLNRMGVIPVTRDGGRNAIAALERSREVLRSGQGVGIHPEGTRSPDGRLYRGHTGAAWMSLNTGAPVVPCGLTETHRVQPPGRLILRPTPFGVHFGAPLSPERYAGQEALGITRRRFTDEIMRRIAALSGQQIAAEFAVKGKALAGR